MSLEPKILQFQERLLISPDRSCLGISAKRHASKSTSKGLALPLWLQQRSWQQQGLKGKIRLWEELRLLHPLSRQKLAPNSLFADLTIANTDNM